MKKWFEGAPDYEGHSRLWQCMTHDQCPNVFIGSDPCTSRFTQAEADTFDIILNVGDNLYTFEQGPSNINQKVYWYPLVEMGRWHYSTLFACFHILDLAITEGKRIYIHCAAGAYRSPGVVELWHLSRGESIRSLKDYVGNHCGPEFYRFCKEWRSKQAQGLQYSLMSLMVYATPKIGVEDQQLYSGKYREDYLLFQRNKAKEAEATAALKG